MRVVPFLLCLLGTASSAMLNSEEDDNASVQFPKCEACVKSMAKLRNMFLRDPFIASELIGRFVQPFPFQTDHQWDSGIFDKVDDGKLTNFVLDQLTTADDKGLCGDAVTNGIRACTREPTLGRLLVLVEHYIDDSPSDHSVVRRCKDRVDELQELLLDQDAQNELKHYSKAACTKFGPADWCNKAISRNWDKIASVVVWALDISKKVVCEQILINERCFKRWTMRELNEYGARFRLSNRDEEVLFTAIDIFYNKSVSLSGYRVGCALCQIAEDRLTVDHLPVTTAIHDYLVANVCNKFMRISEIQRCAEQIDDYIESTKRMIIISLQEWFYQGHICRRPCSGLIRSAHLRSASKKDKLLCETCRYTISTVSTILKDEDMEKDFDRYTAKKICEDVAMETCDPDLCLSNCESLEDKFGPGYYGKLAEQINEDQCFSLKLCLSSEMNDEVDLDFLVNGGW